MVHPGYRKRTIFLLVALLLVRFWFGQTFELSGQEAYLWLQGHGTNLSPAYWERGPLVPVLIRIGTAFFGDTELGVRWPAAVICCTSGFILFYLARHWFNARAAFWTVVLFIIVPMFAWKLSFMTEAAASIGLMALAMFAFSLAIENDRGWWWLLGGAACGMALLVRITECLVGRGVGCSISRCNPDPSRTAREARLWGTIIFACLFLAPLIWWWRGPQVADVAHTRIINAWPLSHGFSLQPGLPLHRHGDFLSLPAHLYPSHRGLVASGTSALGRSTICAAHLACRAGFGLAELRRLLSRRPLRTGPRALPAAGAAGRLLYGHAHGGRPETCVGLSAFVLIVAGLQSLAGLNPYYFAPRPDGHGYQLHRAISGENATSFYAGKRQISWRNLADAVQGMQRDLGATLLITDTPETASALSFYLPHNPFVYVESKPNVITHFDFWPGYAPIGLAERFGALHRPLDRAQTIPPIRLPPTSSRISQA